MFYLKNIHLCTSRLKSCLLHWKIFKTSEIYIYRCAIIHLCDFYLKYTHLYTIIQLFDFSSLEVYTPPYDYTPLLFFLPEVYTPLWDNKPLWFFSPEVYNLCAIMHLHKFYLKYTHFCAIIHLCDLFNWSIYTSVRLQTSVIFLNFP